MYQHTRSVRHINSGVSNIVFYRFLNELPIYDIQLYNNM